MHASCIFKIVARSPVVGSVEAVSADARIMAIVAGGMGLHATSGGLGKSLGMVIDTAYIANLAAMYDLFGCIPLSL